MTRTKKVILFVLCILALIAGLVHFFKYMLIQNKRNELNAFVKPMYSDLVNHHWDNKVFTKYACPEATKWLANKQNSENFEKASFSFNELGNLQSYGGIVGFIFKKEDENEKANVYVKLNFDKGVMLFSTQLSKVNSNWCLLGLAGREFKSKN